MVDVAGVPEGEGSGLSARIVDDAAATPARMDRRKGTRGAKTFQQAICLIWFPQECGDHGPETKRALTEFQHAQQLPASGRIDDRSLAR